MCSLGFVNYKSFLHIAWSSCNQCQEGSLFGWIDNHFDLFNDDEIIYSL